MLSFFAQYITRCKFTNSCCLSDRSWCDSIDSDIIICSPFQGQAPCNAINSCLRKRLQFLQVSDISEIQKTICNTNLGRGYMNLIPSCSVVQSCAYVYYCSTTTGWILPRTPFPQILQCFIAHSESANWIYVYHCTNHQKNMQTYQPNSLPWIVVKGVSMWCGHCLEYGPQEQWFRGDAKFA